jgi:hypothetical protein
MQETPEDIGKRMTAVIQSMSPDTDEYLRPHLMWVIEQIVSTIRPAELTSAELSGLCAVLVPIHGRLLLLRDAKSQLFGSDGGLHLV